MTQTIGAKLTEILSDIALIFENQAGSEDMPYIVYTLDLEPTYCKDGISKLSGTLMLYIYAGDAETAISLKDSVIEAVAENMQGGGYRSRIRSATSDDNDGIYSQTLEYFIAQLS